MQTCTSRRLPAVTHSAEGPAAGVHALRARLLKVTVFDAGKRAIAIDVPLLGIGLAFDKATK